jgi:hypothetical protein
MTAPSLDRAALIAAIDKLHEEGCVNGEPAAHRLSAALGWDDPDEWPEGDWIRARLHEAIR